MEKRREIRTGIVSGGLLKKCSKRMWGGEDGQR